MTWFTTNEPLKPGFYWWRSCAGCPYARPRKVDDSIEDFSGQWLGPITPEMAIEWGEFKVNVTRLAEVLTKKPDTKAAYSS